MPTDPTYTFDAALPTDKDRVRMRVGDSNGKPQWFLADQTINAVLANHPFNEACAQCAESIGAMCAQQSQTFQEGDLKVSYQERSTQMFKLAKQLRDLAEPEPDEIQNFGSKGDSSRNSAAERYRNSVRAAAGIGDCSTLEE